MFRFRLASKLALASIPIGLVALMGGGYTAWTFLDEAAAQDATARASTVASQAMATLRTMWSEQHLANTLLLRPDQVDPNNLESIRVELDTAVARMESSVNSMQSQVRSSGVDIANRIDADTDELRVWLTDIRSAETLSAADVATYAAAGDLLLDVIGQTSLNLDDREKAREISAAEALAQAALVSFQQEQMVREFISRGSAGDRATVEETLNAREASFQDWTARAADASPIAAQELADLAAMEAAVTGRPAAEAVEVNSFPTDRNELIIVAAERLATRVAETAIADAAVARSRALVLGGAVALILLIAAWSTVRIGRSLVTRVRLVTDVARRVADIELPNLVHALRNPQEALDTSEPADIEESGSDEVGELARSFAALHGTLVEVARQQMDILRRGVSEIFVTLARRNSSLVDRQLALIDQLEARQEDPEILGGYYKLDHLGTRMRRNAESLLVLAGTDTPRMWDKPLEIGDVVRAALGEVDEYQRIDILALEPVRVSGQVVADIAHLLSELLDNATQFSPPNDRVRVAGHFDQDGYLVTVSDHGMGMSESRQAELNRLLAEPPVLGLALEPTLGLYVVARLAARHGINVRLVSGIPGITVRITIPRTLLETSVSARPDETPRSTSLPAPPQPIRPPAPEREVASVAPDRGAHRTHQRPGHDRPIPVAQVVGTRPQGGTAGTTAEELGMERVGFGPLTAASTPTPTVAPITDASKTSSPPKRYEAGAGLPTRIPGASFTEVSTNLDTSSKSEMGPEGIKTALTAYQAGRVPSDRKTDPADHAATGPQGQPSPGKEIDPSSKEGAET